MCGSWQGTQLGKEAGFSTSGSQVPLHPGKLSLLGLPEVSLHSAALSRILKISLSAQGLCKGYTSGRWRRWHQHLVSAASGDRTPHLQPLEHCLPLDWM